MKDIIFNVKKEVAILDEAVGMQPWELFDKLGDMTAAEWCSLVSSPDIVFGWKKTMKKKDK